MRKRLLLSVIGVGVLVAGCALLWNSTDLSEECYERIEVGKPLGEAEGMLLTYGFHAAGATVLGDGAVLVYRRDDFTQGVVLSVSLLDSRVRGKELAAPHQRTSFFARLWRRLTGG